MEDAEAKLYTLEVLLRNAVLSEQLKSDKDKSDAWQLYRKAANSLISDGEIVKSLTLSALNSEVASCKKNIDIIISQPSLCDIDKQDILNSLEDIKAITHVINYLK